MFWPGMYTAVLEHLSKCEICQKFSSKKRPPGPVLDPFDYSLAGLRGMEHVQIDLFEPVKTKELYLVLVERITGKSSKVIIRALEDIFTKFGYPKVIMSDNMTGFTSEEIKMYF